MCWCRYQSQLEDHIEKMANLKAECRENSTVSDYRDPSR
jgi:hypothetical protein